MVRQFVELPSTLTQLTNLQGTNGGSFLCDQQLFIIELSKRLKRKIKKKKKKRTLSVLFLESPLNSENNGKEKKMLKKKKIKEHKKKIVKIFCL